MDGFSALWQLVQQLPTADPEVLALELEPYKERLVHLLENEVRKERTSRRRRRSRARAAAVAPLALSLTRCPARPPILTRSIPTNHTTRLT